MRVLKNDILSKIYKLHGFPFETYFLMFIFSSFTKIVSSWRYSLIEESLEDQEDSGWKHILGDVFRFPKNKSLFSAIIGSGTQLLVL